MYNHIISWTLFLVVIVIFGISINLYNTHFGNQDFPVVVRNAGSDEPSCQAILDRQPLPDKWDIGKALSIKERNYNPHRMGKTHIVVLEGGLITVLKLGNAWGSTDKNKKAIQKKDQGSPGYGLLDDDGISLISKYNCSFWLFENQKDPVTRYGDPGAQLLHELFIYHIDRVLGFNTVPEGKLVAISPAVWTNHFASSVCANPYEMKTYMDQLVEQHGNLRLLGWLQYFVEITTLGNKLFGNWSKDIFTNNECGRMEVNTSKPVIYNSEDLNSTVKYYKYALAMKLGMRGDVSSNCFFARHLKNPVRGCVDDIPPFYTPVNVDNDRLEGPTPTWEHPCLVPRVIQENILGFSNFTDAVLHSIAEQDGQYLGEKDMNLIRQLLAKSQHMFTEVQSQFRGCQNSSLTS